MKTYKIIIIIITIIIIIKGLSSALVEVGSGTGWTVYSPQLQWTNPGLMQSAHSTRIG
jgi:hypothetical protein